MPISLCPVFKIAFVAGAILYASPGHSQTTDPVGEAPARSTPKTAPKSPASTRIPMNIKIGTQTFSASLEAHPTAAAFQALLPMTVKMSELNGNEKFFRLAKTLPTDAANPETIQSGDLLLYGSDTVVLFYKTFRTSYPYTRLGRIDDPAGLAAAVGLGSVEVTYELE